MRQPVILLYTLVGVFVSAQDPTFPPGCGGGFCNLDHAVCGAQDVSGTTYASWESTRVPFLDQCACDWDYAFSYLDAECNYLCQCDDVSERLSTAQPPIWDLENSGFTTNHADEIVFAIQRSKCYDNVEYAFGNGPIAEADWADWEIQADSNTERIQTEDCKVDIARTLTWYEDKENVIKAIHDPNSPMFLTEQFGPNSVARVPLPEEYFTQFEYYNEFIVYDGCLNTREVTTFDVTIGGETFEITRYVDNVLKFKIEFPTRLEICTNITVEVVEITEVLVNQTVYCTEDGGFAAELTFQTFVTWPYRMNTTGGASEVVLTGEGSECFTLTLTPTDDSACADDRDNEPVCVQTWSIHIEPDGDCDDICTINGEYNLAVNLQPQPSSLPDTLNPLFDTFREFSFTVTSADFCSRVIAEAEITQEMDAYHDVDRDDDDTVFFVEDRVFVEAIYNSPDATIYDVDRLFFTVKNYNTNAQHTLYNNSANTGDGNTATFSFNTPTDNGETNPFLVWPEFNLSDSVFHLAAGIFPVTLELCLGVNLTFLGNENDGSSGVNPPPPPPPPVLLELMEMVDNTKFQLTEVRRQILVLPDGSMMDITKQIEPEVVLDVTDAKAVEETSLSPFSVFTFVLAAAVFVGLAMYAFYVWTNKGKYSKISTRVDAMPRGNVVMSP